jgi:hypothetical protein
MAAAAGDPFICNAVASLARPCLSEARTFKLQLEVRLRLSPSPGPAQPEHRFRVIPLEGGLNLVLQRAIRH